MSVVVTKRDTFHSVSAALHFHSFTFLFLSTFPPSSYTLLISSLSSLYRSSAFPHPQFHHLPPFSPSSDLLTQPHPFTLKPRITLPDSPSALSLSLLTLTSLTPFPFHSRSQNTHHLYLTHSTPQPPTTTHSSHPIHRSSSSTSLPCSLILLILHSARPCHPIFRSLNFILGSFIPVIPDICPLSFLALVSLRFVSLIKNIYILAASSLPTSSPSTVCLFLSLYVFLSLRCTVYL